MYFHILTILTPSGEYGYPNKCHINVKEDQSTYFFKNIFPETNVSVSAICKTLALFQKSLVSENEHSDMTVDKDLKGKKEGNVAFVLFLASTASVTGSGQILSLLQNITRS